MTEEAATTESPAPRGFLQNLFDLYLAPRETFTDVVRRPRFLAPLLGLVALNLAFTGIWLQKVDPGEFLKAQLEESGRWDKIPPERREAVMTGQSKFFPVIGWVGGALGAPIVVLVVSTVLLFVYRFFYAGEVTFGQSFAIATYSFLTVSLVSLPLLLLTLTLKGDWNVNPREALVANLAVVLDKQTASKALYALAQSLDLFSFWLIFILATGYAVATRRSTGSAATGILVLWGILVLGKVGVAAFFG